MAAADRAAEPDKDEVESRGALPGVLADAQLQAEDQAPPPVPRAQAAAAYLDPVRLRAKDLRARPQARQAPPPA